MGFSPELSIVLLLVLAAEFVNGWTDAPNSIATVVSTRALSPKQAVVLATILNFAGALSGTAVALTIGQGIVDSGIINLTTIGAAMVAIVTWSTVAWRFGLPTSETHALVSGLAGAALATAGPGALLWAGWKKVLFGLVFSTAIGFFASLIIVWALSWGVRRAQPARVSKVFGKLQIFSAAFVAFSHGSNDGQKLIGIFTLTLVLGGVLPEFKVPYWVILLCALVMGVGTATGGWRIIKTMGVKLTKLEPVHGFAVETAAATCIEVASRLGIPLSTTHTVNTAIMGVGATKRLSAVRWGVGKNIVIAWVLTFPVSGLISWGVAKILIAIF